MTSSSAGSTPAKTEPTGDDAPSGSQRLFHALVTHHRLILAVVLIGLFIGIRLLYLTADPPMNLPNNARIYELFTDPAAKSFEARNRALFGVWKTSESDNYQFWRLQAPVWVYPLSWFYRAFGVGYAQMRIFSTLCAASGLAMMFLFAKRRLRGWPYFLSGAFITFNYYYIIYGRSGLLEALINTYIILTVLFVYLAQRRLVWIMAAQLTLVAAVLTKQTALFLLPLCLVGGLAAYRRAWQRGLPTWLKIAPIAQALGIAGFMAWYVLREAYWRTVTWNYGHMLFNKDGVKQVEVDRFPLWNALDRLRITDTWDTGFFSLFPVAGTLAVIELLRITYLAVRKRRYDPWEMILSAWAISAFGVLLLTPFLHVHYRMILFPPVALLAGSLLQACFREPWMQAQARLRTAIGAATLGLVLLVHGTWYTQWVGVRSYSMVEASRAIEEAVGDQEAVFAGMWAGPLIFDTKYKYYYIKTIFNTQARAIADLRLTHMLELDRFDLASGRLWRTYPEPMRTRRLMFAFDIRDHAVTLYEFRDQPKYKAAEEPLLPEQPEQPEHEEHEEHEANPESGSP